MNVLILYFSATGNTAKIAKVIEERFAEVGGKVTMANMTSYKNRQEKIDLTPYEAVVSSAEFLGAHTFNLGGWKAMMGAT